MTQAPEVIGKVLVKYDDGTSSKRGTNKDAHRLIAIVIIGVCTEVHMCI